MSGRGSVSDQREAACVGDLRVRERHATRDPSFCVTPTNSLSPTLSRPASREPACSAAPNFQTSRRYLFDSRATCRVASGREGASWGASSRYFLNAAREAGLEPVSSSAWPS